MRWSSWAVQFSWAMISCRSENGEAEIAERKAKTTLKTIDRNQTNNGITFVDDILLIPVIFGRFMILFCSPAESVGFPWLSFLPLFP
jgi:hypothetical protein